MEHIFSLLPLLSSPAACRETGRGLCCLLFRRVKEEGFLPNPQPCSAEPACRFEGETRRGSPFVPDAPAALKEMRWDSCL